MTKLAQVKTQLKFHQDYPLNNLTTLCIGGKALYYAEVSSVEEILEAVLFARSKELPFFVVGKGSNTLFDDKGYKGVVILNKIHFCEINGSEVYVSSGYNFSLLGAQTAKQELSGLEFASGIPGTVGGAVFMNAGANGTETCDHLVEVEWMSAEGKVQTWKKSDLDFRYRHSIFHEIGGAILSARFHLVKDKNARKRQLEIIKYRTKTQPYGAKTAGCFFRNPEGKSAGALIDQCGLKGVTIGGAAVSDVHANFIVNCDNAQSSDVMKLATHIQDVVYKKTGILLQLEVDTVKGETKN